MSTNNNRQSRKDHPGRQKRTLPKPDPESDGYPTPYEEEFDLGDGVRRRIVRQIAVATEKDGEIIPLNPTSYQEVTR